VFETTLAVDGRVVALEAHLERLAASLAVLYGEQLPSNARALIADAADATDLARLRLTVVPDDDAGTVASVRTATVDEDLVFPTWERAVELAPVVVPGGIGAHKWADRRLLEQAEAESAPAVPLVVDSDGAALEGSRGNLFLVRSGTLVTPPTDGRLLPGITRALAIEAAQALGIDVREQVVSLEALASAQEVFLTGGVRGVESVRRCSGVGEWHSSEVTAQVGAELRRSWLNPARSA
jgi:para-aminobenzoate synthetase/4-amino-4-deoxychorismate lyase